MPPDAPAPAGGDDLLVCVYYRVGAADAGHAMAAAREFQRTLGHRFPGARAEVLLRWELPRTPSPDAVPTVSLPAPEDASPEGGHAVDATLMETYRLAAPAAGARAFLAELEACAAPLAPLLRGARHVEMFRPCA